MGIQETEDQQPDEQGVAIYSKQAVLWFSIFFSPIAGAILLMLNLRSIGYKKEGNGILLLAVVYQFISGAVLSRYIKSPDIHAAARDLQHNLQFTAYSIALGLIGAVILAEYFFKKFFLSDDYERKSIVMPLLIALLVAIPLQIFLGL